MDWGREEVGKGLVHFGSRGWVSGGISRLFGIPLNSEGRNGSGKRGGYRGELRVLMLTSVPWLRRRKHAG